MSLRTVLILLLALAFGGSAAIGVSALLGNKSAVAKVQDTVPIVIAAADVPRSGLVTSEVIRMRDCPKDLVPVGAIMKMEDAINRAVLNPLVKDEPILEGKLAPKGAGHGLAAVIPKGMRALSIQTPSITSGVSGFILPGNRVDVLLTSSNTAADDKTGGGSTTTLLQNVEILAVDSRVEAPVDNKVDPNEMRSVTLLVTPDQAAKLDLGQSKGTLHLSLRNMEDTADARTRTATFNDLRLYQEKAWDERAKGLLEAFGKLAAAPKPEVVAPAPTPEPQPIEEPPPAPRTIRIYRGTQWSLAN